MTPRLPRWARPIPPPDPRTTYDATDPVEDAPLAHKHALTRAVQRVIELSAHLDVDAAPDGTVEDLTAAIDAIADRMEPLPSLLARGGLASWSGTRARCSSAAGSAGAATLSRHRSSG